MSSWILLSMVLLRVLGAGVSTHLTYLARVAPHKFEDYGPWLKAGAFFPDSLYSCRPGKKLPEFAERAHWPQFLITALQLWQETYGGNKSERDSPDSLRLQAFLTGIFSHQIVDSSWHSLVDGYRSHGLLRVLAETEFDGDIDEAHNFIDVMGEFLVLSNVFNDIADPGWQYYTDSNWSLPREEDVMELLYRNGLNHDDITYEELRVCVMRGLSASLSEVYVTLNRRLEILNVAYGISPGAKDFIQDCWQGGEFDLIAMMQVCLPVYQSLFESDFTLEQQVSRIQLCGNLPEVSNLKSESSDKLIFHYGDEVVTVSSKVARSNFGASIAVGRFGEDNELYAAVSAPLENSMGTVYLIALDDLTTTNKATMKPFTPMRGLAMHTYTFHEKDFLAVSEPGSNSIHFYRAGRRLFTIHDGTTPNALQLQLSHVADIDGDGIPDLILSSTSYGVNETGCTIVVMGSSLTSFFRSNRMNDVDISALRPVKLTGKPFNKPYQHFGAATTASYSYSRVGFLYVTCQSLGTVFAYSLDNLKSSSFPDYMVTEKEVVKFGNIDYDDVEIISSSSHGMFGKTMISWSYKGTNFIAVSQHLFNCLFIYREIHGTPEFFLQVERQHDTSSSSAIIGFGSAIEYDSESHILYISSPGFVDGKGAIWRVSMQELANTVEVWKQDTFYVNLVSHLYLTNPQSDVKGVPNFGKTMKVAPDGRIIVGAPQLNYGNLLGKQLTGAIIIR